MGGARPRRPCYMMVRMFRTTRTLAVFLLGCTLGVAEKMPAARLLDLAQKGGPELEQALRDTLTEDAIRKGSAVAGEGANFIWAVASDQTPRLVVLSGQAQDRDIAQVSMDRRGQALRRRQRPRGVRSGQLSARSL